MDRIKKKEKETVKLNKKLSYISKQNVKYLDQEQQGYIIPDEGEETNKLNQEAIKDLLPNYNAENIFSLTLPKGPFKLDYSANGKKMLLSGRNSSAVMNWKSKEMISEVVLGDEDKIRGAKFINNDNMFALSQNENLCIYDTQGIEIHSLSQHSNPMFMENLPFHYLLAWSTKNNYIKYLDYSIGEIVSEIKTKFAEIKCMISNPQNSVIITGHSNGTVNMWTPNYSGEPVVKFLSYPCSVSNLSIDPTGNYLMTTGLDKKLKVWDLRNNYRQVHDYFTPHQAQCMGISQKGLLAVGYKGNVEIWKDIYKTKQQKPYLKHHFQDKQIYASSLKFIDYEDFLGIGHNKGYSQIVTPGSGEPNFDTYEVNLYETKNQKKNSNVKKLLEKIPYTMIAMNSESLVNTVNANSKQVIKHQEKESLMNKANDLVKKEKKKMRLSNKERHDLILKELDHIEGKKKKYRSILERNHERIAGERETIKDELNVLQKVDDDFDPELNLVESNGEDNEEYDD
eukprot:CAMPEP_0170516358 /NCGR_PEP_ID=MMETSP0209-20121228/2588_1 /TAXON_ID=665100 ORGANISM="Litonotus pictus, Strain P1" /NCGR_SAMPLE_ID=MMETSP0209 /ASSEMBLY_ACC=CAM_ASM_000301 /LENGTH=510 /DNA_ID=CAMNT_0010801205 /DNA_START=14 /DNA_END=1546 /DNA_ORIENTATION=-